MLERLKSRDIQEWYSNPYRKPLVIWGARQVGKTYIVKDFLKNFKKSLFIDLAKDSDSRNYFSSTSDPDKYLLYIEARFGKMISNDCPLAFDEVQQCPNVLTSLKYFYQDHPELPVIATGSLVRLAIRHTEYGRDDTGFLFPVGSIDLINLYPLTFEEYLLNTNRSLLKMIKEAYAEKRPLLSFAHDLALDALYEYLSVGGMPEVLSVFLSEKSYVRASSVLTSVFSNYLADMDAYNVSNECILRTRNVYRNIYSQLNKECKNFKVAFLEKGRTNRDYINAYQWLELARVVIRCRNKTGKVTLPLTDEGSGLFRLYLADPGIFLYESNLPQSDFIAKDKRNALSGILYENYVADELVSEGIDLYYWTGKNSNEMEFVVQVDGNAVPVDVKKGSGKMNSLESYRMYNPKSLAVKISSNNYGYDQERMILTIPLYEVFLFAKDVAAGRKLI